MKNYKTIKGNFENTIVIEKSKFICYLSGIDNEEEAKLFIEKIKKINSLATHNCYSYIADEKGLIQKFSDDGEPQGTAGVPMLEVLKNNGLYKCVAVVTRYFGGIKLGVGGLNRAYSSAVSECIKKAKILNMEYAYFCKTILDYDGYSKFVNFVSNSGEIKILDSNFDQNVQINFVIKADDNQSFNENKVKILNFFCGKINIEKASEGYYSF